MTKSTFSLAAFALATLTACQAPAPAAVAVESPAAVFVSPVAVVEAPRATALPAATSPSLDAASPAASPADTCAATADEHGYFGFYARDPWQAGETVLTFDDGPHPTFTPRVLDALAERKMHATFFVVGRNISRDTYPLVQRMVAEGHILGSHSYSHDVKMTRVDAPADTVEAIQAQHESTAILIDIALLAKSGDDFDAMFRQVFESDPRVWLTGSGLKKSWRGDVARHRELLVARGFDGGARPYAVLYSRPPGGGPYVEHDGKKGIALHDAALQKLGMMNVLWHGASGDTVPGKRSDLHYLTDNMDRYARKGGVLLIHDYIRPDALTQSLDRIAADPGQKIVSMNEAVQHKYACSANALGTQLVAAAARGGLPRGIFMPPPSVAAAPPVGGKSPVALAR